MLAASNNIDDYLPPMSNFKFGNSIFANLGGSGAHLSGSFLPQQNFNIAQFEPITFPWINNPPAGTVQQIEDMNLPNQLNPNQTDPNAGAPIPEGENKLVHFIKLYYVGLFALVLVAIGLYMLSQQTAVGQAIKEKAVEAAKTAGEVAVVA